MPPKLHRLHPKSLFSDTSNSLTTLQALPSFSKTHRSSSELHNGYKQHFSSLNRPPPLYAHHVPISTPEHFVLSIVSTVGAFLSPRRPDLIALCSETTTPLHLLRSLRDAMLSSPSGRRILRNRPRISTKTVDVEKLLQLPDGTLGRTYAAWLEREGVTPDTRDPVRHVPEEELAYVLQRYRESHDLYHVLLAERGMPSFMEGEIVVKAFEFAGLGLPMTGLAALAAFTLKGGQRRRLLWGGKGGAGDLGTADAGANEAEHTAGTGSDETQTQTLRQASQGDGTREGGDPWLKWALKQGLNTRSSEIGSLLSVYWEEEWGTPVSELRTRLGIELPRGIGDLREVRRRAREERLKMKRVV